MAEKLQRDLDEMADWNFNRDQETQQLQARAEKAEAALQEERACHDCAEARAVYRRLAEATIAAEREGWAQQMKSMHDRLQADLDAALDLCVLAEYDGKAIPDYYQKRLLVEALLAQRKEAKR